MELTTRGTYGGSQQELEPSSSQKRHTSVQRSREKSKQRKKDMMTRPERGVSREENARDAHDNDDETLVRREVELYDVPWKEREALDSFREAREEEISGPVEVLSYLRHA